MNALRLALGTLTVFRVPAPSAVDRRTAGWAMALAPLVGGLLGLLAGLLLWLLGWLPQSPGAAPQVSPLLAAGLVVGLLALATRGLHLDGLADTADGLGSGRPPAEALEVMRRGDVGPFGVVTVLLVVVVQVAALAGLISLGLGALAVAAALAGSRLVLAAACVRRIPAARTDGLGSAVAGSVGVLQLVVAAGLATAAVLPWLLLAGDLGLVLPTAVAVLVGALVGVVWCLRCVRRFGGVTGDVLGSSVEVAFAATLLALALAL